MVEYCIGFVAGVLTMLSVVIIMDRENRKTTIESAYSQDIEKAKQRKREIMKRTKLSYHDPNKKAPTDGNQ